MTVLVEMTKLFLVEMSKLHVISGDAKFQHYRTDTNTKIRITFGDTELYNIFKSN